MKKNKIMHYYCYYTRLDSSGTTQVSRHQKGKTILKNKIKHYYYYYYYYNAPI